MAYSESLALRVRQILGRRHGVAEKRMFGGVGFLLHGNMCVGIWKNSLIARINPAKYEPTLAENYVREFDITGRPMRGWIMIEPDGVDTDDRLGQWIERSLQFVSTLPAKLEPKSPRRKERSSKR
jgi:TfoX/Sxy family transcriptional regulator of competence genes